MNLLKEENMYINKVNKEPKYKLVFSTLFMFEKSQVQNFSSTI